MAASKRTISSVIWNAPSSSSGSRSCRSPRSRRSSRRSSRRRPSSPRSRRSRRSRRNSRSSYAKFYVIVFNAFIRNSILLWNSRKYPSPNSSKYTQSSEAVVSPDEYNATIGSI